MAQEETYPVGAKVRIRERDRGKKPEGWNSDMMPLIGEIARISLWENGPGRNEYRYRLNRWEWSWRHCDLILLELPKLNPNSAFRNRKHENR